MKRKLSDIPNRKNLTNEQLSQIKSQLEAHLHSNFVTNISIGNLTLREFMICADVFRADIMSSSLHLANFLAENKSLFENKSALDMGCGTGIQGAVMALCGANSVVLSDVSPIAVKNARANMRILKLKNITEVVEGDLFRNLNVKFDVIVFNHPFFGDNPIDGFPVSATMMDSGPLLIDFLNEAKVFLNKDGIIIMPFFHFAGTTNDPGLHAERNGYEIVEKHTSTLEIGMQKGDFSIFIMKREG